MAAPRRARAVAAFLRGRALRPGAGFALLTRAERYLRARTLVNVYYALVFYFGIADLYTWGSYRDLETLAPRWPVAWLAWVDTEAGVSFVLWLHLVAGIVGLAACGWRGVRILVFVSLLEFLALKYSFGAIDHGDHLTLLISFVLIFLPRGWRSAGVASRQVSAATLLVFSGCQGIILLTYSMAGFWKLGGALRQMAAGEVSALAPSGLARQIAGKLVVEPPTPLGPWLIDHYWVGWPLMLATIYLQLFALWALFRPRLHPLWGIGLALFHVGSHLTLGVGFALNTLWLALFLVLSPFAPRRLDGRQTLRELPLVGAALGRLGVRDRPARR